jgi:protein SCO1/2
MKPIFLALLAVLLVPAASLAQYNGVPANGMMTKGDLPSGVQPADLKKIAFDQKLNAQIPLDLAFCDESGRAVTLDQYFHHGRPVVVTLVYYDCPMLCTLVLNALAGAMKGMSLNPGSDYDLVTVSFNPRETPALAAAKKTTYIKRYGHDEAAAAWHFLTGDQPAITRLTDAVGFHYVYDERTGQYAHATGIMIATPEGRLAKYLYGIEYSPRELRMALVDASAGRIGNPVDQVLLYCYHYDPSTGKYGLVVLNVIRLGGLATLVVLGSFVGVMFVRERKWNRANHHVGSDPPLDSARGGQAGTKKTAS